MDISLQDKKFHQLLVFNENQGYIHYKKCDIRIDEDFKELLMIPSTGEKQFIPVTFDRQFFRFKNIIYIPSSQYIKYSYVLIPSTGEFSDKIFAAVQKVKIEPSEEIIERKQECLNLLAKTSLDKSIFDDLVESFSPLPISNEDNLHSEDNMRSGSGEEEFSDDSLEIEAVILKRRKSSRKRNRPCYNMLENGPDMFNDMNDEFVTVVPKKKSKSKNKEYKLPVMDAVVKAPNFNVINYIENGISKSRLFIFPSYDRTMCYVYFYDFNRKIYLCTKCNNGKCTPAVIEHDSNGTAFVKHRSNDHICQMREYEPTIFKTDYEIRKPNYDFDGDINSSGVHQTLLLFTSTDKKKFYKLSYDTHQKLYICLKCCKNKNHIQACVCQDDDGEIYISVRNREHICMDSPLPYLASNEPSTNEIATFNPPDYQHVVRNSYRIKVTPLPHALDTTTRTNRLQQKSSDARNRSPSLTPRCRCQREHGKETLAESCHHQESESTHELTTAENHPSTVQKSKQKRQSRRSQFINDESRIIRKPHYQLLEKEWRGKMFKKLFVFDKSDKIMCREYTWSNISNRYVCNPCTGRPLKIFVSAKVVLDENGEECIQLGPNDHKCQMKKFEH